MTIEDQKKFNELEALVKSLESKLTALNNNATIPFDIGEAFKARILADSGVLALNSKLSTSEDVSVVVSVGPTVTDDVLDSPDGFLAVTITGNNYYIPYYI